jgi:hypothetical protein
VTPLRYLLVVWGKNVVSFWAVKDPPCLALDSSIDGIVCVLLLRD